jgi:predicted transcriptional regulator
VYTYSVKNITLSADDHLIEQARTIARGQHTTLNAAFREWLEQYVSRAGKLAEYDVLMQRLAYADAGRKFRRDEINER